MQVKSVLEQLYFTTIFILTKSTTEDRFNSGTGFFFTYKQNGQSIPFLVTAKHLVEDTGPAQLRFHVSDDNQPNLGKTFTARIEDMGNNWFYHPNPEIDIAISPVGPILNQLSDRGVKVFYKSIVPEIIPSDNERISLDAVEEVIFIGYPSGLYDKENYLPIIRKGITASPISVNYEGNKVFLIDASVFPGSSGSPVLLVNIGSYSLKGKGLAIGQRIFFLGVLSATTQRSEIVEIGEIKQYLDIGLVFRSETILEAIDQFIKIKNIDIKS